MSVKRAIHAAVITSFALPSLLFATRSDELTGIMESHVKALGGKEAILSLRSLVTESEMEIAGTGLVGRIKTYSRRPCFSYTEVSLGFFNIRHGYDGDRIWMVDPNGELQLKRDQGSRESQVTTCIIENFDYIDEGRNIKRRVAGRDTIEGTPCTVVELGIEGGSPCRIYFDASNYLIKRLTVDDKSGRVEQTFDDYRPAGGLMIPFMTKTYHAASGREIVSRTVSVQINVPIDPVIFLPPPADTKDYRFTAGGSAREIPFVYRLRHIYLPVRVGNDDKETMFIIDSGAGMTVIDSTLASRLNLPLGGVFPGVGAGGTADFYMTRIPGLSLQGVSFSEQTVVAYPISRMMENVIESEIGGILGYDFLSRFVTQIDYERKLISFYEPDSFEPAAPVTVLEAPLIHNIFSVEGTLDKAQGGSFLLDTGANNSMLQRCFVDSFDLLRGRRFLDVSIIGAGGEENASLCRFTSFSLGGHLLKKPVFAIPSERSGIGAFEGVSGLIGNDMLERFRVTLNYRKQWVFLEPNRRIGDPFYPDKGGLQITRAKDGSIIVHSVIPGSPAEKAGVKAGDEILSIDGREASAFDGLDEIIYVFQRREGDKRELEIKRKGRRKKLLVQLKSYL